jgi:hypothetical protein
MDSELSEHSGDIRQGGQGSDRSRNKDWGIDGKWLEGCEVNDGDGDLDTNWGVDGKLLRERDGRIGDGSGRVFISEVIVAVRGHVREGVLVKLLGTSGERGMRRLSEGSPPYMCCCAGVGSFKLPHLIVSKYVILINPHILRVWVSFPFDQIL